MVGAFAPKLARKRTGEANQPLNSHIHLSWNYISQPGVWDCLTIDREIKKDLTLDRAESLRNTTSFNFSFTVQLNTTQDHLLNGVSCN